MMPSQRLAASQVSIRSVSPVNRCSDGLLRHHICSRSEWSATSPSLNEADNKHIGLMCFIAIDMTEISTCKVTLKVVRRWNEVMSWEWALEPGRVCSGTNSWLRSVSLWKLINQLLLLRWSEVEHDFKVNYCPLKLWIADIWMSIQERNAVVLLVRNVNALVVRLSLLYCNAWIWSHSNYSLFRKN